MPYSVKFSGQGLPLRGLFGRRLLRGGSPFGLRHPANGVQLRQRRQEDPQFGDQLLQVLRQGHLE